MSEATVLMGKSVISVFIEEQIKEELKEMAEDEQRSMSQMASILIAEAIKTRKEAKDEGK